MHMDIKQTLEDYEKRAREQGLILDDLLKAVPMDRSTWTRWKSGDTGPRLRKWLEVQKVFSEALAEQSEAAR